MNAALDLKAVRKACRDRLEQRRKDDADDRVTLSTCTACGGSGSFELERTSRGHRAILCPFCDGECVNDSSMKEMYAQYVAARKAQSSSG